MKWVVGEKGAGEREQLLIDLRFPFGVMKCSEISDGGTALQMYEMPL